MAVTWGAASGYMRVGIDVSQSGSVDSGSVKLTVVYYLQSVSYGHNWTSVLHRSGAISGDVSVSFSSGFGATTTKEVARQTITVATQYGTTVTKTFRASLGPIWNGGAPSVSHTHTVAARAYAAPYAPSSVSASTTDGKTIRVSWSQRSDAAHPVKSSGIERYDNQSRTWVRVGTVQGTGTAWTDSSLAAGRATYYRVWAWNGRESGRAQSATVWTTPTPATNVTATKNSAGDIIVSWAKTVLHDEGSYDVYDNGVLVGSVGNNVTSFTHRAPDPAAAHTYTVVTKTPNGLRSSASSPSPAVQVLGAPSAPTVLGPTGTVAPGRVVLSWRHNPTDSTAQTAARVEVRRVLSLQSLELVHSVDVTGSAQSVTVTLPVGLYIWTVRTRGLYDGGTGGDAAAWSPTGGGLGTAAQFRVSTPPEVSIRVPSGTIGSASTGVEWAYHQAEGSPQLSAVVELSELVDGVASGAVETVSVSGPGTSASLRTRLPHGSQWRVTVTVVSAVRQSTTVSQDFGVVYPAPPAPVLDAAWDETTGAVSLSLTNPPPLDTADTVSNLVVDPRMVVSGAWRATSGVLTVAGDDGWASLDPVLPAGEARLSLASPVPVSVGQPVSWAVDLAVPEGGTAAEDTGVKWTGDWSAESLLSKTADQILSSNSETTTNGTKTRAYTPIRPWPDGRTYRLALDVSTEKASTVWAGVFYFTAAGSYTRSYWIPRAVPAGADHAIVYVDVPAEYQASRSEAQLRFIFGLLPGGGRMVVHRAAVLDLSMAQAGAAPAADSASLAYETEVPTGGGMFAASVSPDGLTVTLQESGTAVAAPDAGAVGESSLLLEWLDTAGAVVGTVEVPVDASAGAVRAVASAVAPAGTVSVRPVVTARDCLLYVRRPLLAASASPAAVTDWWDPTGPYAVLAGQSYAVSWDGEPDASTSTAVPNSPAAVSNRVSRSVDGGASWEPLEAELPLDYSVSDPLALSCGQTQYRAESVSEDGATAATLVVVDADSQAMWLGGGPGYAITAPLPGDPQHTLDVDLADRDTVYFAGRRLPVELAGTQETRSLSVSATLTDDDMPVLDTLAALAVLPGPVVYRDPVGRRMWCSMSGLRMPRDYRGGVWAVSLDLVEVDPDA